MEDPALDLKPKASPVARIAVLCVLGAIGVYGLYDRDGHRKPEVRITVDGTESKEGSVQVSTDGETIEIPSDFPLPVIPGAQLTVHVGEHHTPRFSREGSGASSSFELSCRVANTPAATLSFYENALQAKGLKVTTSRHAMTVAAEGKPSKVVEYDQLIAWSANATANIIPEPLDDGSTQLLIEWKTKASAN